MVEAARTQLAETMICDLGPLSCSDGSAEFTNKDTSVIVSVNGPMEIKMSKENIEKATIELLFKQKSGLPSCADRFLENQLKSICETIIMTDQHPRSSITVVIQEIYDNGCLLAASFNALCLALLDASLPMSCIIAASTCALNTKGDLIVSPNLEEENEAKALFTVVFETQKWQILSAHCKGMFSKNEYMNAVEKCRENAKTVHLFIESVVQKKFAKYT